MTITVRKACYTFLLLGLLAMLAACGQAAPSAPAPTATPALSTQSLDDLVIRMERGPCFGACPMYSVTILGDGSVEYIGDKFVAVEGVQEAQLSEAQLRELVAAFEEAGFWEMQDRYESNSTDLPSTITTITLDGRTKSVYNYDGAPDALRGLESTIDRISGASEWVGQP